MLLRVAALLVGGVVGLAAAVEAEVDSARALVTRGDSITLTARTDPGAEVVFVSRDDEARVTADASGLATWTTAAGQSLGPYPIDVLIEGTEDRDQFPVTVTEAGARPATTAGAAQAAAHTAVSGRWFRPTVGGPFLVRKGALIEPAGRAPVFEKHLPLTASSDQWLFWIDDRPGERFEHPVRVVLVDAVSDASLPPAARVLYSSWWPVVDGVSLLGPAAERVIDVALPAGAISTASPDACAVLAFGGHLPGGQADVRDALTMLLTMDAVQPANVRALLHPATSADLAAALAEVAGGGCRTLHLILSGHGGLARGGYWLADDGPLPYESIVEMLSRFPELDLRLRIAAPAAGEAASWMQSRGWTGGFMADSGGMGLFTAAPFWSAFTRRPEIGILPEGRRRWAAPPVDVFAEGGLQRIELRRPKAVGLGRDFVVNVAVEDQTVAAGGPSVFFLPSDQDAIRYSFVGRKQGRTTYGIVANDNTGQVYEGAPVVQVGSLEARPDFIGLSDSRPSANVELRRFGYWLARGFSTQLTFTSRNPQVATIEPQAVDLAGDQATATFEIRSGGPGATLIDVYDAAARSTFTIDVRVEGGEPCPSFGSSAVRYEVRANGDSGGNAQQVNLSNATLLWEIADHAIRIWGDRSQAVAAQGPIDDQCRFAVSGTSRQARVGGFQNIRGDYVDGSIENGRLAFTYRLGGGGGLPGGSTVTYDASGAVDPVGGGSVTPALHLVSTAGGLRSAAVSTLGPWAVENVPEWVEILEGEQGDGPGVVRFLVLASSEFEPRSAILTIAGEDVTVVQDAGPNITHPLLTAVGNAANFQEGLADGAWLTLSGFGLADRTATWFSEAAQGTSGLPTELAGVTVHVNGREAFPSFVSPTQINALAPADLTAGRVEIEVEGPGGRSNRLYAYKRDVAPDLFRYVPREGRYPAAVAVDGSLIGPVALFRTVETRPARAREAIQLFGNGFGPTDPPTLVDELVFDVRTLVAQPVVRIGGVPADVLFAGIVGSGLVQINLVVPDLPPGEYRLEVFVDGRPLEDVADLAID